MDSKNDGDRAISITHPVAGGLDLSVVKMVNDGKTQKPSGKSVTSRTSTTSVGKYALIKSIGERNFEFTRYFVVSARSEVTAFHSTTKVGNKDKHMLLELL